MFVDIYNSIPPEYRMAWGIYFACAGVLFLVIWRWTKWIAPALLKHIVRFAILGAIIIPMPHTTVAELWVPAIGIAVVSGIIEGAEVAHSGLRVVGYGALFGGVIGLIPGIIETLFRRKFPAKPKKTKAVKVQQPEPPVTKSAVAKQAPAASKIEPSLSA